MLARALAVLSLIASLCIPRAAFAQPPAPAATAPKSGSSTPSDPDVRWFRLPLGLAYAAPFALLALGGAVSRGDPGNRELGEDLGAAALIGAVALPPLVRAVNGASDGIVGALAGTLGSAAAGGLAGGVIGTAVCDRESDWDCIGTPIQGAAIGLIAGYAAWGLLDSLLFAHTSPRANASADAKQVVVSAYLAPLRAASRREGVASWQGLAIGAVLQF